MQECVGSLRSKQRVIYRAMKLYPLPKIPVFLILWLKDEEYPPRADLLFDSTCEAQVPLDIIWSIAMLSVLVML
jgi:hypothetical protein